MPNGVAAALLLFYEMCLLHHLSDQLRYRLTACSCHATQFLHLLR